MYSKLVKRKRKTKSKPFGILCLSCVDDIVQAKVSWRRARLLLEHNDHKGQILCKNSQGMLRGTLTYGIWDPNGADCELFFANGDRHSFLECTRQNKTWRAVRSSCGNSAYSLLENIHDLPADTQLEFEGYCENLIADRMFARLFCSGIRKFIRQYLGITLVLRVANQ